MLDPGAVVDEASKRRGFCGVVRSRGSFVTVVSPLSRSDDICADCMVGLMRWHWSEMMAVMNRLNRGSATLRDLLSSELNDGFTGQTALLAQRFGDLFSVRD